MRSILMAMSVLFVATATAEVMCECDSQIIVIDQLKERKIQRSATIRFSSKWEGDNSATVILSIANETVKTNGTGWVRWIPVTNGIYVLTHKVMRNGVQVGETLTATLEVVGLTFSDDAIPNLGDNPTVQEIESALKGSTDARLTENITDATTYGKYRDWASKVKMKGKSTAVGAEAVKTAPNAWLSFALGSETLIETAPTDGDLKVDNFEPATESGKFDFTVSVTDIEVGSEATADNLKKVFGLEGGTTLEPGGLSSDNVNITFGTPENGKVKFTAGPKNASEGTFFMKVKMTP